MVGSLHMQVFGVQHYTFCHCTATTERGPNLLYPQRHVGVAGVCGTFVLTSSMSLVVTVGGKSCGSKFEIAMCGDGR